MKSSLILVLLFYSACSLWAQEVDSSNIKYDGWIEKMDSTLSIKIALTNDFEAFFVDDGNKFTPEIYPNTSDVIKISFNYRILSFSFKHAPASLPGNSDTEEKGETDNFGLRFSVIQPHIFAFLTYSRNQGYYLENTKDFNPLWKEGDKYIQFPEMEVKNYELVAGYSFNERFSIRSLSTQTERQLRSTGSFIPIMTHKYYLVDNQTNNSGQKSQNYEVSVGAGYHHTFVFKRNFYFSMGLIPSYGKIFSNINTLAQSQAGIQEVDSKINSEILRVDGRSAIGYNGRKYFAGVTAEYSTASYDQENTAVVNSHTHLTYQFFVGIRLAPPKKLKNLVDKVTK